MYALGTTGAVFVFLAEATAAQIERRTIEADFAREPLNVNMIIDISANFRPDVPIDSLYIHFLSLEGRHQYYDNDF
jgi:hypothetical protein